MVKETVPQIAGTSITTTAKVFTAAGVSIITLQNALAEHVNVQRKQETGATS